MLLVSAVCAVLFHGAFSAPNPIDDSANTVELRSGSAIDDEKDENPLLIAAAKLFIKVS